MINIYNNKEAFLRLKPHKIGLIITIFVLLFILTILFSCLSFTYDNFETKGFIICDKSCQVTTSIPSNISFTEIYLNKKVINYQELKKELKVDQENYISYYEITFTTDSLFQNSEIVNLNFYYNKQRIITKLINLIF